ncbi:DUF4214 domain-containing protein [Sulfitobacter sp. KE34]|uniref:DUF4214 domain-containing protein n=1 Tax=unclassified Sulfitobacter TaxID=196795 RepID=UPI0023E160C8|nr:MULTISPECIES: DUF4214 domain-containing protein [unclassified Sulfitobacter]MDF3351840.1 DUF4214 domain-containing protein [Sulfitobacter sp. KE12]MDF3355512.1 DUF4214 domain-containing protein [Sulfitobacter sp. KE27]MDF3359160.1 DUF4214 domain-containing protein [Sulfitobacter sp. KE33]MDF3366584.1 DUF4214 domain-containing protein [Sulfitobacter sp. Ks34]MDF3370193.1 DUF4214 domain-containing protein [Sulfitobacter sp. Ks43]
MEELTVGDIRPLLTLIADNPLLNDSEGLASQLRSIITSLGVPITAELDAALSAIEANPILISAGVEELRSAIADLPDSALISEIEGLSSVDPISPEITQDANGNDIQSFQLPFSGTTISIEADEVTVTIPGEEPQKLVGLDRLEFIDGTLFLDVEDGAGLVKTAYEALLGNAQPDAEGFDFWLDLYEGGTIDTFALTNAFTQTEAFSQQYEAALNDSESLIRSIYQNLFDREADDAGLNFWTEYLDLNGIASSVDEALAYMMQSDEFAQLVGTTYSDGVFV